MKANLLIIKHSFGGVFLVHKICINCGKEKEIACFIEDKSKKDGHRNTCKECHNLKNRKTPIKPKPREEYKYCADCGKELSLDNFNMRFNFGKVRPFSYCKSCEHKRDTSRYPHVCNECGKIYKSGAKDTTICKECKTKLFAETGKNNLQKFNSNQYGENNRMYGIHRFGADNPNYNPNKTDEEREFGRSIKGYGIFIQEVYKRDNYTCQICGERSGDLNAHHLDSYNWCKENRTNSNNGITLCNTCHKRFHSIYGYGHNTKQQFEQFTKKHKSA